MPIAKYTSAKGLFELTDGSSGFFVEDAPLVENQQTLAIVKDITTITCVSDANKNTSGDANSTGLFADTGELVGDFFYLVDAEGNVFYVWYQDAKGTGTDPNTANALGAGYTAIEVTISNNGGDNAATVAEKTANAIDAVAGFFAEHASAVITVTPLKPGSNNSVNGDNKTFIEGVLPGSRDANDGGGNATAFTIAHAQAATPNADQTIEAYGATSFSCATDMASVTSNSKAASTELALADGSYVGQKKFLFQSAAGAQTTDAIDVTGVFENAAGAAKTKIRFNAANEFIMLEWLGAAWNEVVKIGVTFP